MGSAQAKEACVKYDWRYGRVSRMGSFEIAGDREVVIIWEERGGASQQGNLTDDQWEIFKLAFGASGRIAVPSYQQGDRLIYDYRFLEAAL